MNNKNKNKNKNTSVFLLKGDVKLTFTNHENQLLFLHTEFMSAQLAFDNIGVKIERLPKYVKVGFMSLNSEEYHSFYFKTHQYKRLLSFFILLGFPCDEVIIEALNGLDYFNLRTKQDSP